MHWIRDLRSEVERSEENGNGQIDQNKEAEKQL